MIASAAVLVPQMKKEPQFGAKEYAAFITAGAAFILATIGSTFEASTRKRFRGTEHLSRDFVDDTESFWPDRSVLDVPILPITWDEAGREESDVPTDIVDLVLARRALAMLHRYEIPQKGWDVVWMRGGLIRALVESGVNAGLARSLAKETEKARRKAVGTRLLDQMADNAKSRAIPVADIRTIEWNDKGTVTIRFGFECLHAGASREQFETLQQWLRDARIGNDLSPEDPKPLSRRAIDVWASKPGGTVPEDVKQEFAAMENRPTIQASLASGAPLRLARAIRRMPEPMAAAMRVRYHILNVAMGRHVKWLTSAIGAVVLGVPLGIIFLAGGLGHGEKDLAPLLVGGVLSLLGLYGLITLPICLCLLHRINSEAGQCA